MWPRHDFVLVGSAALAARGIRDVNDLDVQICCSLWPEVERLHAAGYWPKGPDKAEKDGGLYEDGPNRRILLTGQIDFFDAMPRISSCTPFEVVFRESEWIGGFRIVSLRHCLAVKALANRKKDHEDMETLARLIRAEEAA
jgi:hypothetical protein